MVTITTLLSGGEGVGVGARAAGLEHLDGYEIDDNIAGVARANGFNVHTANVLELDPVPLRVPDVLHASPVCKNALVANQSAELNEDGTKESPFDIAMGQKIAQFIDVMKPRIFTLENVYAYRNFKAFKIICAALSRGGYMWDFDNLNAADYGVPQTRRRLILRAVRGALLPNLPQPERWVGWYEAIEDLIPGLPESQFAAWQLARLPEEIKGNLMSVINGEASDYILASEPIQTVASNHGSNKYRAFVLDCQLAGDTQERGVTLRQRDAPMFTVTSGKNGKQPVRAWLVEGQNTSRESTVVYNNEPSFTVLASSMRRPASTPKAWLSQGRVVSMTPRALARFQSLPDSYLLPDNKKLACTVIGNMVPPLLYQKIIRGLTE